MRLLPATAACWLSSGYPPLRSEIGSSAGGVASDVAVTVSRLAVVSVAVDALLGTGAVGPAKGELLALAERLAAYGAPIVAVDGPTGLDLTSGEAHGPIRARNRTPRRPQSRWTRASRRDRGDQRERRAGGAG